MKKLLLISITSLVISIVCGLTVYADDTQSPTSAAVSTESSATTAAGEQVTLSEPLDTSSISSDAQQVVVPAETTEPAVQVSPAVTQSAPENAKINKNDPLYIQLQEKYKTIENLRTQEQQVCDSIKAQNTENADLRNQIKSLAGIPNKDQVSQNKSQINDLKNQDYGLRQQKDSLQHELAQAYRDKDKSKIESIKTQIANIEKQIKDNSAAATQLKSQVKSLNGSGKEAIKKANADISKLNDQINYSIKPSILDLRANKDQEWIYFGEALKKADLSDANSHFDKIITYKQQIIDLLKQVLSIKQNVHAILQDVLNTLTPAGNSAASSVQ